MFNVAKGTIFSETCNKYSTKRHDVNNTPAALPDNESVAKAKDFCLNTMEKYVEMHVNDFSLQDYCLLRDVVAIRLYTYNGRTTGMRFTITINNAGTESMNKVLQGSVGNVMVDLNCLHSTLREIAFQESETLMASPYRPKSHTIKSPGYAEGAKSTKEHIDELNQLEH